jgi:hypothetical protein
VFGHDVARSVSKRRDISRRDASATLLARSVWIERANRLNWRSMVKGIAHARADCGLSCLKVSGGHPAKDFVNGYQGPA